MISPWPDEDAGETWLDKNVIGRGGAEFAALHTAHRLLQNRLAGAVLPPDLATSITEQLTDLAKVLGDYQVPEADRWDGWRPDLPGRGLALLPEYFIDDEDETSIRGHVTFTRFYLGGNGAAHGGSQPLLFDDVFGRVANHHQDGVARTAYLKVNYRRITPIDVELTIEASLDKIEGRKRWVTGRLYNPAGELVSDAEGLFLQLLPGQQ